MKISFQKRLRPGSDWDGIYDLKFECDKGELVGSVTIDAKRLTPNSFKIDADFLDIFDAIIGDHFACRSNLMSEKK